MTSQKYTRHSADSFLLLENRNKKTWLFFFILSFSFHVVLFGAVLFFPEFKRPKPMPQVIQVDLVSFAPMPAIEESGSEPDSAPAQIQEKDEEGSIKAKTMVKAKPVIAHKKPDISLKTKPKNLKKLIAEKKKKSPKKKNPPKKKKEQKPDPEKLLAEARQELAQKVEDEDQSRIRDALSRLRQKVKTQGEIKEGQNGSPRNVGGGSAIDMYKFVFGQLVRENWVFNETLAKLDQNLEVRLIVKILKSGEIRDIIYETKSGNKYLDESAKKAIKKTNPLPRLPQGMSSWDVVVIFTPKGLK